MKSRNSKPPPTSGGKTLVSKQVYQVAKSLAGTPMSADANNAGDSRGGDGTTSGQVHFSVNTKLPAILGSVPSSPAPTAFNTDRDKDHHHHLTQYETDRQREKQLEAEIMGESTKASSTNVTNNQQKSQAIEKNLNQMIKVLNSRLQGLDQAAKTRLHLLEEDLKPLSNKMSEQAPKIVDEFDDSLPKSLRDAKSTTTGGTTSALTGSSGLGTTSGGGGGGVGHVKDNLVNNDQVFIDPFHLVVRTKQLTEAGKKLESVIEESFGSSNLRELKHKNKKNLNQSEKSKRTEQLKNEAKRMNRLRIEKKLQLNMENFVTRSVMDMEYLFNIPETNLDEIIWPVSIKWSSRDPLSAKMENADGEFDPDLLLRYAIERINLPSGRKLFTWLVKQVIIQRYFVAIFWLLKVKFFDHNVNPTNGTVGANATSPTNNSNSNNNNNNYNNPNSTTNFNGLGNGLGGGGGGFLSNITGAIEDREIFLLKLLAQEYRSIVELLANRSHAEHEKDFVYKYLPFILTNGVYYSFYYIFPGSRHLYTKGFKKTIYMQIIKVMHGFQICPISVKVSWAKLFPEDVHDDNDEGEDGGEVFPVKLAIKTSPLKKYRASRANSPKGTSSRGKSPSSPTRTEYTGISSEDADTGGLTNDNTVNSSSGLINSIPTQGKGGMLTGDVDIIGGAGTGNSTYRSTEAQSQSSSANENIDEGGNQQNSTNLSHPSTSTSKPTNLSTRPSTALSEPLIRNQDMLLQNPVMLLPLSKTYLQPLLEKPSNIRALIKRQNNCERLNAQEISPQMTLFLASMSSTSIDKDGKDIEIDAQHSKQTFRRTIPVQWCAAGGSDTHQKRIVATDVHNEFSVKLKQSQHEYQYQSYHFHHEKIKAVRDNNKTLEKILTSGPTNISRLSLDLIRRQRSLRGGNKDTKSGAVTEAPQTHMEELDLAVITALANYDDEEIERFLAEL